MNEMKQLMTELTDRLRKTNEYNQYIAMVKELQEQFLEGSAVETSFLEG